MINLAKREHGLNPLSGSLEHVARRVLEIGALITALASIGALTILH